MTIIEQSRTLISECEVMIIEELAYDGRRIDTGNLAKRMALCISIKTRLGLKSDSKEAHFWKSVADYIAL